MSDKRSNNGDNKSKRQYRMFAIDEHGKLLTGELILNDEILDLTKNSLGEQDDDLPFDIDFQKILRQSPSEGSRPIGAQGAGIHVVFDFDAFRNRSDHYESANDEGYPSCVRCGHPYALDRSFLCECGRCQSE